MADVTKKTPQEDFAKSKDEKVADSSKEKKKEEEELSEEDKLLQVCSLSLNGRMNLI